MSEENKHLLKCSNPECEMMTRPSRMQPLASVKTLPRVGDGLCSGCYSRRRRARRAAQLEGKPVPRQVREAKRPTELPEERIQHIAAGLSRFERKRRERLARKGRVSA